MERIALVCLGTFVIASCGTGSNGGASSFGASSSFSRRDLPDGTGQVLMYTNRHAYPVVLMTLTLTDCQNVRGGCRQEMAVNERLDAGATMEVLTVFAIDPTKPMSYEPRAGTQPLRGR